MPGERVGNLTYGPSQVHTSVSFIIGELNPEHCGPNSAPASSKRIEVLQLEEKGGFALHEAAPLDV